VKQPTNPNERDSVKCLQWFCFQHCLGRISGFTMKIFMLTDKPLQGLMKISLLVLTLFIFSGCSSVGSKNTRYYPVKQHTPRENSLGFSILPPPGSNWYEKLRDNSLIYLKKKPTRQLRYLHPGHRDYP